MSDKNIENQADAVFPEQDERKPREPWRLKGSIFWPLLLMAGGVLLLLVQLDYIQGDVWNLVLRLWPVLLIGGGLDGLLRRDGVVMPGFWAAAGVILLLANLDLIVWDAWTIIAGFWPLFIVAIGLDILFAKRSLWMGLAALVVLLAVMFGAMTLLSASSERGEYLSQPAAAADATLVLKPIIGTVHVRGGDMGGDLLQGMVPSGRRSQVEPDYNDVTHTLTLERTGANFWLTPSETAGWDLTLSQSVPLDIVTEMAVGRVDFDLSGMQVTDFELDLPLGTALIQLPQQGSFEGDVDLPMGSLEIIAWDCAGFQLVSDGGVMAVTVPDGYQQDGNEYTSPDFESMDSQVILKVDSGMARILVTERSCQAP